MDSLSKIAVHGYKSIRDLDMELKNINILIGGNGAGKSNLFSFFEMLKKIEVYGLQDFTVSQGGANKLLYNGRKVTEECLFEIRRKQISFRARLIPATDDRLYFSAQGMFDDEKEQSLFTHGASLELMDNGMLEESGMVHDIGIYHFHDTSVTSLMKTTCDINDNEEMASDGRNIAAILYRIRETKEEAYERIVKLVRMAAPYFQDFLLRKNPLNPEKVRLEWKKRGCDVPFGAEQLSDGTLRFICLVTLFCLPYDIRKTAILLDEPELGLHPFAITVVTELMKKYAGDGQVIAATQSADFVNEFEPGDVIVAENQKGESVFGRVSAEELGDWLEDYTLGELWKKNVIGGRP